MVINFFHIWIKVSSSTSIHMSSNIETNSQMLKVVFILLMKRSLRGRRDRGESTLSRYVSAGWW